MLLEQRLSKRMESGSGDRCSSRKGESAPRGPRSAADKEEVGFFRFKRLNGSYLLTNDIGDYCFLSPSVFEDFINGDIRPKHPAECQELQNKGFIRNRLNLDDLSLRYAKKSAFLNQGPSLHIVVVTLRCDHRCIYCQTGSKPLTAKGLDMDIPTARKVVDAIFASTSQIINLEFQGGEPLVNFEAVKFIIEYANKRNKLAKKKLFISLVSNMTFMTQEKLRFLLNNNVAMCTSLEGPEFVHNKNRISKGNSHNNAVAWIKKIKKEIEISSKYKYKVNALTTLTRHSLRYPKQIVDEFVKLGLEEIHLRPVNPFGLNSRILAKIDFSADDFIKFYRQAMDYIIELNKKGKVFYERTARILIGKILSGKDPNFLDLRSPCGAGIGQLAYNYNGDVYTCDEARMLSVAGDESFKVGNALRDSYEDFINNNVVKTLCYASCLDNLAGCSECAYKPYCGVCPIYNYVTEGDIFSRVSSNKRCKIHTRILDYLFERLRDPLVKEIFEKWAALERGF